MKKTMLVFVFLSLALALGFSACSLSLAQDVTPPPGYQPPVYEEAKLLEGVFPQAVPNPTVGEQIYQEKCLPCHGEAGLGDGPDTTSLPVEVAPIGSAGLVNPASPLKWFSITTNGNIERFMPPFSGSLDEQDVWDVLSYVYTFGRAPGKAEAGEAVFAETCAECHGVDGTGAVPGAANLTDAERMVELSINDVVQQVATGNGNQDHVFSTVLNATQMEEVAYYVRTLIFPLEGEATTVVDDLEPTAEPTEVQETPAEDAQPDDEAEAPTPEPADETDNVTIGLVTGVVTNGSGDAVPEGLEVTLEAYQHFEQVLSISTPVLEDGSFEFEGIPIEPEQIYIAVVEIDGLFYPSEFYIAEPGDTIIDLPVTIYSTTTSTDDLAISRLHVFFQFTGEGTIQVIHQVTISNRGNEMVAPGEDDLPVVNFNIPEDAQGLIFQQGAIGSPYVQTATGFGDPTGVLPGENTYEILFAYELPYERSLNWELPADMSTDVAVIFVQGDQVKVDSELLVPSGTETLESEVFQVFVGNNIPGGQTMDLAISGRVSDGTAGTAGETNWLLIGAGALGVALALFGAWQFFRPVDDDYDDEDDYEYTADDDGGSAADSEAIMDEIIALDQAFEAGAMEESDYQTRRDELKAALKDALDKDNEGAS